MDDKVPSSWCRDALLETTVFTSKEIWKRKMNILLVGGNFADEVRPSGFIQKLYEEIKLLNVYPTYKNGGTYEDLLDLIKTIETNKFDVIMWFANVPNTYEKLVGDIKVKSPKSILVTSKNNIGEKYTYHNITARMLKVKANLCLVFTKTGNIVETTIIDPLMNAFAMKDDDPRSVAKILMKRAQELKNFTRQSTCTCAPAIEVPNEEEFFGIAHKFAETFHELIHAENTERYLGNLSFRCENGFPSFKHQDMIFVSRRNIDKRDIGQSGFVGVALEVGPNNLIGYYGDNKPSVDTPVQVGLYNHYHLMKYMMHSHVYIKGAPFTKEKIPCGAIEEIESIISLFPDNNYSMLKINLLGHGSLIMSNSLEHLKTVEYYARPFPEYTPEPKKKKKKKK